MGGYVARITIGGVMKYFLAVVFAVLLAVPAFARDQHLELRANGRVYAQPSRDSDVLAELKAKDRGRVSVLTLASDRREHGYYHVIVPNSPGTQGWIYKSYVRPTSEAAARGDDRKGERTRAGGSAGAAAKFQPTCELPFPLATERREISDTCGVEGSGRGGKALSTGNRLQNHAKNNLCASGPAVDLDFKDFLRLQKTVDEDLGIEYGHSNLPDDRSPLKKVIKVGGKDVGEGSLVRYVGYINHPRNSNVSKGETVNCNKSGAASNDIHVDILKDPEENICSSITVEIIPHYRPKLYNVNYLKELQDRPFRFTGQMFFDGAHKPCKTLTGPGGNPKRATVWEIHPVYAVDVCRHRDIKKCKATDNAAWLPMQDAINEVHEEDDGK